jgi:hypothetical protein
MIRLGGGSGAVIVVVLIGVATLVMAFRIVYGLLGG